MKVLIISLFTPSLVDKGAPGRLIFDLCRYAPGDVSMDLLLFQKETNQDTSHLKKFFGNIWIMPIKFLNWLDQIRSLTFKRRKYTAPSNLSWDEYDFVFLYQEWLYPHFKDVHSKIIVSGMDCSTLLYLRSLINNPFYRPVSNFFKMVSSFFLERSVKEGHFFHTVGERDLELFRFLNPRAKSGYCPLPIPPFRSSPVKGKGDKRGINIGITGHYCLFYHGLFFDKFLRTLMEKQVLPGVRFSFLGKGWGPFVNRLRSRGYDVLHEEWVDSFPAFISNLDVHLDPRIVGAGTKQRVLCSVASGVITFGTEVSFENIHGVDPIFIVSTPGDAYIKLKEVSNNIARYQEAADLLAERVVEFFDPERVVGDFWRVAKAYAGSRKIKP